MVIVCKDGLLLWEWLEGFFGDVVVLFLDGISDLGVVTVCKTFKDDGVEVAASLID